MKKLTNIFGIFFGISGILLLAYSAFIYFYTPYKQEITALLPAKHFEFIAFSPSEKDKTTYQPLQEYISFYTPQENETVVSYFNTEKNTSELIIISDINENTTTNTTDMLCKKSKKYRFCTAQKNTFALQLITSFQENTENNTSIATLLTTQEIDISNSLFFGTTSFLIKNSTPYQNNTLLDIKNLLILAQDSTPYFSGTTLEKNISLFLHKAEPSFILTTKTTSPLRYHANSLSSQLPFQHHILYISQPSKIIELIQKNTLSKHFVEQVSQYKKIKDTFTSLFKNKISYANDIKPLLDENILITPHFIAIHFPNTTIAQKWYKRYYTVLQKLSEETIPKKTCITLQDNTQACEIFPSQTNTEIQEKDGYTSFITTLPEDETGKSTKITKSIMIQNNTIFLSNSETPYFTTLQNMQNNNTIQQKNISPANSFFFYQTENFTLSGEEKANSLHFTGTFLQ